MSFNKKVLIFIAFAVLIVLPLSIWIYWGNTALELNKHTVKSKYLPKAFDGFRIVQVSDLHNTEIGKDNEKLLSVINEAKPDIIAVTGDIVDSRKTDLEISLEFVRNAVRIAPCYYVTGNHESRIEECTLLLDELRNIGVTVLRDEKTALEKDTEKITVSGVDDPYFATDFLFDDEEAVMASKLSRLELSEEAFTVLLSHRPELFEVYSERNVDLVLTGHAHGGQFRLPFIGGLFAPHQGILPKYSEGIFAKGRTNMVVSRGIGNSVFPFRFNNRPEAVLIELQKENKGE